MCVFLLGEQTGRRVYVSLCVGFFFFFFIIIIVVYVAIVVADFIASTFHFVSRLRKYFIV